MIGIFAQGVIFGFLLCLLGVIIATILRSRHRPQATRILLSIKEIDMPQSFTLKVGKTYLITPSGVDDTGAPETASGFAYVLDDTTFGTLTPASDGSTATLVVLKAGTAKLTVTGNNAAGTQISGEGDFTANAALATSITLQVTEQ
jgi:hypothetical protein